MTKFKDNRNTLKIVLFEPRIPQNTGCIARTTAALDITLILIKPLGFSLEDKYMKRAGLDYWPYVKLEVYDNYESYLKTLTKDERIIACSKSNGRNYKEFNYKYGDNLLFGREDTGLPKVLKDQSDEIISIPMPGGESRIGQGDGVRSLNLSVAMGIISFEASSQLGLS